MAFLSSASNLVVPGSGQTHVYVHDLETGITTRTSVNSEGQEAFADSSAPSISGDGRYVAFSSDASNLVPSDNNNEPALFVHDRLTTRTMIVSIHSAGHFANGRSRTPSISADGRLVAFSSHANNLSPNDDTNFSDDIFAHRLTRGMDCMTDSDCDDGLFCTGVESCVGGQCSSDGYPCSADQVCDDEADGCRELRYKWTRTFGGPESDDGQGLAVDGDGDILLAGSFRHIVDFDPSEGVDEHITHGQSDIFVAKLASEGSYEWTWAVGSTSDDAAQAVAVDADHNVIVGGPLPRFS